MCEDMDTHKETQDDNATLKTWHPEGKDVEKKSDIMPHHEVLMRLDAIDMERGESTCFIY